MKKGILLILVGIIFITAAIMIEKDWISNINDNKNEIGPGYFLVIPGAMCLLVGIHRLWEDYRK